MLPTASSPLSDSPVTIQSLAPELVAKILELAVEGLSLWSSPTRRNVLLSASLVYREWCVEARALLWREIILPDDVEGERLLCSSALGLHQTRSLVLHAVTTLAAGEVLHRLLGLQSLEIWEGEGTFDSAIFCAPGLKDLTFLKLSNVTFRTVLSPSPSFQLSRLEFDQPFYPFSFPWSYIFTLPSSTLLFIPPSWIPRLLFWNRLVYQRLTFSDSNSLLFHPLLQRGMKCSPHILHCQH